MDMRIVTAAWRRWHVPGRELEEHGREPESPPESHPEPTSDRRPPMQLLMHTSTWLVWRDDKGRIIYLRE